MENKLSSIFVLIFIVFIAGLSFWLSLEVKKELTDDEKNTTSAADFYLKNFHSKQMTAEGFIKYTFEGQDMNNYKYSEKTFLTKPIFVKFDGSNPVSNITGDLGEIINMGQEIVVKNNVVLTRLATSAKKKMSLYTNQLNIIPSEDVVFSKKAVKIIQEPNIEVDGVGMKYDKKDNTIKLLSNVKVHYEKPKK